MLVSGKLVSKQVQRQVLNTLKQNSAYNAYFKQVQLAAKKTFSNIKQTYPFEKINFNQHGTKRIYLIRIQRGGAIMTFRVLIGWFSVLIVMLNVNKLSSNEEQGILGKGSFGSVLNTYYGKSPVVAKRIYFKYKQIVLQMSKHGIKWEINGSSSELYQILYEYAINKICSLLKIGPRVGTDCIFDLVCFQNCIQFQMQRCYQYLYKPNFSMQKLELRLKYCLRVLHLFHIIHKDIKPQNILYSEELNDFVLVDFGISDFVIQCPDEMTLTFKQGTPKYMSPELSSLRKEKEGLVNLYSNDMYSLKLTVEYIKKQLQNFDPMAYKKHKSKGPIYRSQNAIKQIAEILYKTQQLPQKCAERISKQITQAIGLYFPQANPNKSLLEPKWNPDFLLRSIGFNKNIQLYLRLCPQDERVKIALACLQQTPHFFLENSERNFPYLIQKNIFFNYRIKKQISCLQELLENKTEYAQNFSRLERFLQDICADIDINEKTYSCKLALIAMENKKDYFDKLKVKIEQSEEELQIKLILLFGRISYIRKSYTLSLSIFQLLNKRSSQTKNAKQIDIANFLFTYFKIQLRDLSKIYLAKIFIFAICQLAEFGRQLQIGQLILNYKQKFDTQMKEAVCEEYRRSFYSRMCLLTFMLTIQSRFQWLELKNDNFLLLKNYIGAKKSQDFSQTIAITGYNFQRIVQQQIQNIQQNYLNIIKTMATNCARHNNYPQIKKNDEPMEILLQIMQICLNPNYSQVGTMQNKEIQLTRCQLMYLLGYVHHQFQNYQKSIDYFERITSRVVQKSELKFHISAVIGLGAIYITRFPPEKILDLFLKYQLLVISQKKHIPNTILYEFHVKLIAISLKIDINDRILEDSLQQVILLKPVISSIPINGKRKYLDEIMEGVTLNFYQKKKFSLAKKCGKLFCQKFRNCKFVLGACLYREGDFQGSLQVLVDYNKDHSQIVLDYYAVSCFLIGKNFNKLGNKSMSQQYLRQTYNLYYALHLKYPTNTLIINRLAEVLFSLKDFNAALKLLLKVVISNRCSYFSDQHTLKSLKKVTQCCLKQQNYKKSFVFLKYFLGSHLISIHQKNSLVFRLIKYEINSNRNSHKIIKLLLMLKKSPKQKLHCICSKINGPSKSKIKCSFYCKAFQQYMLTGERECCNNSIKSIQLKIDQINQDSGKLRILQIIKSKRKKFIQKIIQQQLEITQKVNPFHGSTFI